MLRKLRFLFVPICLVAGTCATPKCKTTPFELDWPSDAEWAYLNKSINGELLRTTPVASSCWPGNPFGSPLSCDIVQNNWSSGIFHSQRPESVDYSLYANNSCLPPGAPGYTQGRGCTLGGLPQYIVNATSEQRIATALKWAADRNIRIVVKGTGHDLNARSSGAYSLSIWTHNFQRIQRNSSWPVPNTGRTEDVFVVGSGQQWGAVLSEALKSGRVVTTGQDPSVGLGGYIQGGGHGPLSSTYGLAANQVLQLTVITTKGQILTANNEQNQDLFWALRGGGGGQYGVVTEYIIKHYPAPSHVTIGNLQILPLSNNAANASWNATATLFNAIPDLMDAGFAGAATMATGETAMTFFPSLEEPTSGVVVSQIFYGYNMTPMAMTSLVDPLISRIHSQGGDQTLSITWTTLSYNNYTTFYDAISGSNAASGQSLVSSRLLGRSELVNTPHDEVISYLRTALRAQNETAGTFATTGLQGGPGTKSVPEERWGAVNPVWRSAYVHFITNGATLNSTQKGGPKQALKDASEWTEEVKEKMWREWAPETGAYMNEANPYDEMFAHDFYGTTYERLLAIKKIYDPSESLFVISGVGSSEWEYDLDSGRLCRTDKAPGA